MTICTFFSYTLSSDIYQTFSFSSILLPSNNKVNVNLPYSK